MQVLSLLEEVIWQRTSVGKTHTAVIEVKEEEK